MVSLSEAPRSVPRWPEREDLPKGQVRFVYDRQSDTLFVHFYGEARPASSEPLDNLGDRDYAFLRVDPITDEVVGIQIETFLSYAILQHPDFVEALTIAELHGYNDIEATGLRRWAGERRHGEADAYAFISLVERLGA